MKDEEIDRLVAIAGQAMHGLIDEAGMREGDRAMASLIGDLLKNVNRMADALEVIARIKGAEAAHRGIGP